MEQYRYQKYETSLTSFTHDVIINAYDFTCKRFIEKYRSDVVLSKPFVYQPLLDCAYTLTAAFFFTSWALYVNGHINGDIREIINALHGDNVNTLDDIKKEFQTVCEIVNTWSFLQENDAPPPAFKEFVDVLCDYYKQVFTAVFKELEQEEQCV